MAFIEPMHRNKPNITYLLTNQSWRGCNHRLRIGHTKAIKSHVLSRGLPTGCHHCGQTLTIDHMLLECALLQGCRDEYYTVDSLNALFETIPETCIVEFLWEAGFFYLIWCNLLTSISPQTWTIWSDLSNCLENESNSWDTRLLGGNLLRCYPWLRKSKTFWKKIPREKQP